MEIYQGMFRAPLCSGGDRQVAQCREVVRGLHCVRVNTSHCSTISGRISCQNDLWGRSTRVPVLSGWAVVHRLGGV